jgi:hypothetical protein
VAVSTRELRPPYQVTTTTGDTEEPGYKNDLSYLKPFCGEIKLLAGNTSLANRDHRLT